MIRPYEFITFDCYGTLIDWEGGIRAAFMAAASRSGVEIDSTRILPLYAEIEPAVEGERYRPYRDVLAETARQTAQKLGWRLGAGEAQFLAASLPGWKPFPDTNAALQRLHDAGYALGILSNVDDDLLAETRKHFPVPIQLIVTAQQVRSYKPAAPHFETARARIGGGRWLHAAQSNFHDIVPANARGIPTAWINRKSENALPGGEPSMEFRDLTGLADALSR